MSRVDAVIPCYKYAHFLPACVESVLSQPVDVRVLIIDDASPDNAEDVGMKLATQDTRVLFRRHSINKGHIETYNEGLDWATADYTLLLSADDLLAPGALGRAVTLLDAHPNVGFVYGRSLRFHTEESLARLPVVSHEYQWSVKEGIDWIKAVCQDATNPICSPEVVVRTSVQKESGGYRKTLPHSGDLEMWLRFATRSAVGILETDQAYYRLHGANMHVERFAAVLADLNHRKMAFDILFETYGEAIPQRETLHTAVRRALAREALWAACQAFDRNGATDISISKLLDFAEATFSGSQSLQEYTGLCWRKRLGSRIFSLLHRVKSRSLNIATVQSS